MLDITIWHNPRCSKSRQTLALLEEHGIHPKIVQYLETPPDQAAIRAVIAKMDISARELLRKGEAEYKELGLKDTTKSEAELIAAMAEHPRLIERPVVIHGDKAALGRPPENVLTIL